MAAATSDKRLVRSKSGLKIVSLSTDVVSPLTLDEPQWSPDSEVNFMRLGVLVLQKKRLKSRGFAWKFSLQIVQLNLDRSRYITISSFLHATIQIFNNFAINNLR